MVEAPSLEELISDLKNLKTSNHAHAIGHLCMAWSYLENLLDIFLSVLVGFDGSKVRAAVVNNADARDKRRMIVAAGFLKKPNDEWYERIKREIDKIDNKLRIERNRMVHDQWTATDESVYRTTHLGKVIKTQARELAFQSIDHRPIEEIDVWELTVQVMASSGYVFELLNEYVAAQPDSSPEK